jgi:D-sedoheptulose 7-phosphate isomerase
MQHTTETANTTNNQSTSRDYIDGYLSDLTRTIDRLDRASLERFADLIINTRDQDGTIFVFGNGGSGANASHFCGDFVKGLSYGDLKRFRAICLNDNLPALMAIANDISYDDIFAEQLRNFVKPGDLVIGLSGSGNSENVVRAFSLASEMGATTVALCGFTGGKIKEIADHSVHADIMDMEISEDIHIIIAHVTKRVIMERLGIPCPYD